MTRSELVARIAEENPHLTQADVDRIVKAIFGAIVERLGDGGRVEIRGFGTFSSRQREARQGRNPRTGESVEVKATSVPYFRAGKELRDRLKS